MHSYRSVLAVRGARRLLIVSLIARLPLGMTPLAILLLVQAKTGSFALAGVTVGVASVFGGGFAPVQGALIDRFAQTRVLVPAAIAYGTLLAALVTSVDSGAPTAIVVCVAALAGAFLPPVSACSRTLWQHVSEDPSTVQAAYMLDAVTQELIWIVGPLIVGVIVAAGSPALAVLSCASIAVVGTLLFASMRLSREWTPTRELRPRFGALHSPAFQLLLGTILLSGVAWGALAVALPAIVLQFGSRGQAALVLAFLSLGSMVGGLILGLRTPGSIIARYRLWLILVGAFALPLLVVHSTPSALLLTALAGLPWAPLMACQYTLISITAPRGTMTEAFTWNTAAFVGGISAGSICAGLLIDRVGPNTSVLLVGAAVTLSLVLQASLRKDAREPNAALEAEHGR